MSAPEDSHLWHQRHGVLYCVRLSALYHQKRERFFDLLDKGTKAVSIIGGSAVLAKIANADALTLIAGVITAASTFSLVLGFSERTRRHAELARSFRSLEGDILRKGEHDFEEADVNDWQARSTALEATEPPALGALVVACQNELAAAANQRDKIVPLPLYQKVTKSFLDWHPTS